MAGIIRLYKFVLNKHPILTQSIQTGFLMGTGDFIAQTFVEKKKYGELNLLRTAQFATIGTFIGGPSLTVWYRILDRLFKGTSKMVAVKKVVLDQALFAPTFIVILLTAIGTIQGHGLLETTAKIKHDYLDIVTANYCVWPWVQLANFSIVPLQYQVLVVQIVAIFWNTYLSWKVNKELDQTNHCLE